jgi:hypothetical protein
MTIDRDIIFDLLPLYRAGLASDASRREVDAWFAAHPEDGLKPAARRDQDLTASLDRARQLRRRLRWLYGMAIAFTIFSFGLELRFDDAGHASVRLLSLVYPLAFAPAMLTALACWTGYFWLKRRLR